ncbi:hypothetical protein H0H92_013505, partial [Tricholoma furcatifolium]
MPLLALPIYPGHGSWSSEILEAFRVISNVYESAKAVLAQESEVLRLKYHMDILIADVFPLLQALEISGPGE